YYDWVQSFGTGSTRGNINAKTYGNMPITLPPRDIQDKIVDVLKSLDAKIEVNRRINDNLEQQAQALFKSWFVDFEPFKDGELVESELGMIPKGWRVGILNDIAKITMGTSPNGTSYNIIGEGDVFYQGRAEFGFRFPSRNMFTTEAKRYAEVNSVLLSVRAPVGDINIANERCCIGRGLASIQSKENNDSFVFYLLQSLKPQFERFNGEGTVFGSINKKALEELPIIIPTIANMNAFNSICSIIDDQIKTIDMESRRLAELRDSLLPRLMSGELKVNDVETII
ncbi:MAG: restriction endonuclease subunit S, partial [Bacteroidaceae bacterium]|nr:restriction endonuclease subunit S [Bacteroidaceae bacterium]